MQFLKIEYIIYSAQNWEWLGEPHVYPSC